VVGSDSNSLQTYCPYYALTIWSVHSLEFDLYLVICCISILPRPSLPSPMTSPHTSLPSPPIMCSPLPHSLCHCHSIPGLIVSHSFSLIYAYIDLTHSLPCQFPTTSQHNLDSQARSADIHPWIQSRPCGQLQANYPNWFPFHWSP
jgi:hypothetical protein